MVAPHPDEQAIFEAARKMDSCEARETYLQQACRGDAALERRVQALLQAYAASESFLETPPSALAGPATAAIEPPSLETPGAQIGPYKLLQQIGEPDQAAAHNTLAWRMVTCPEAQYRDPPRAVLAAQKAVELAPRAGGYWNTLGAAHYRAGDWKAATEAFAKSMELRKGGDSWDWFFLAMTHWRLNHQEEARQWYERAVRWMDEHAPQNEELRSFRAEAEELLGANEK